MKISIPARSVLAALTLSIVGCDPYEPKAEGPPKPEEHSASKLGPAAPEPPVMPSPVPAMPDPVRPGMKADEKMGDPKPAPAEKKDEPKLETPPK